MQNFSYLLSFLTNIDFSFGPKMYNMTLILDSVQNDSKLSFIFYVYFIADNKQTILWKVPKVDNGVQRVNSKVLVEFGTTMLTWDLRNQGKITCSMMWTICLQHLYIKASQGIGKISSFN